MRYMSATRILGLAVLAFILQQSTVTAQTVMTNTLETYRAAYDTAMARITADIQRQKDDALVQYGKNLDAILTALKQKGDIDGYAVVQKEAKRLGTDNTILTNAPVALIVPAVASYQKQVQSADADLTVRQTALLKKYIAALNGLVKDLMAKDKIEDAKAAGDVRKAVEAMLAKEDTKADALIAPAALPVAPQGRQGSDQPAQPSTGTTVDRPVSPSPRQPADTAPRTVETTRPFVGTGPTKNTVYLSDLPEVSVSGCTSYGLVKGPLDTWTVNGEASRKGMLACAPSELVYDIGTLQMSILEGKVGIGRVNPNSKMQFSIYGDEQLLWESPVMTQAKTPRESMIERFSIDITGVGHIKLAVDPLGSVNSDHSIWIDPRLSRTPGSRTAQGIRPLREPLPAQASPASPVDNSFVLSGPQEGNEVRLTKAREYTLRGNYSIPAGKILTIEAGVTVRAERDAFLQVFGSLNVEGTENSPVVLCGRTPTPGYWKGICGEPQSTVVNFAVIRDATSAINLPKATITNCLIAGNQWGLLSKNCSIANCIIEKNENGAIHCAFGTTTIEHCTIQLNGSNPKTGGDLARRGIVFGKPNGKFAMSKSVVADNADIGVADYRHASIVEGCIVENNKPADFCVTESNLQVNNCWMGDAVQRVVDQKGYGANLSNVIDIHDGRQGTVIFTAGLKTRPKDCGATLNLRLSR